MMGLDDFRIVENPYLTVSGEPETVSRPWTERLFTRPWRPWRATKTVVPQVPDPGAYRDGRMIYMHPITAAQLRAELAQR